MKVHIDNFLILLYIRRNITLTFADILIDSIRETSNIQSKQVNELLYYHMIVYNYKWINRDTLNCFKEL